MPEKFTMDHLSTAKSKRQFYRILHNTAEKAVFEIETADRVFKKRKIDTFSIEDLETTNFNNLFKHSHQRNDINNAERQIAQNSIHNTVNRKFF